MPRVRKRNAAYRLHYRPQRNTQNHETDRGGNRPASSTKAEGKPHRHTVTGFRRLYPSIGALLPRPQVRLSRWKL